jgi:hypothetical protein
MMDVAHHPSFPRGPPSFFDLGGSRIVNIDVIGTPLSIQFQCIVTNIAAAGGKEKDGGAYHRPGLQRWSSG